MPALAPALSSAAPVSLVLCGECSTHPFAVGADGLFACRCGHRIAPADLELDSDETWLITPAGLLATIADPAVAHDRYRRALALMTAPGVRDEELEDAHAEFRQALAALTAARAMGMQLPAGTDTQIGRVYLACSLGPDGTLKGSNAYMLGAPCVPCAPRAIDPYFQERHPCRNPRGHAWSAVESWKRLRNANQYRVFAPVADTVENARRVAAAVLGRATA